MAVSSIPARDKRAAAHVRLWTHNIYADRAGWEDRRRVLIDGVREIQPDLISLQETMVIQDYDQVADILGDGFHIVHSRAREKGGQGISIASLWPITAVHELDLSVVSARTGDFACTTLFVEIEAPAPFRPLLLANHFPDYQVDQELERERQTEIADRALENMVAERWFAADSEIFALSEPTGSRYWYPVKEHPADKAAYTARYTMPEPFTVVANGSLVDHVDNGESTTFVRDSRDPIASYLVTFHAGLLETETLTRADGLPVRLSFTPTVPDDQQAAFNSIPEMLAYLESMFGPYPFESIGATVISEPTGMAL